MVKKMYAQMHTLWNENHIRKIINQEIYGKDSTRQIKVLPSLWPFNKQ